MSLPTESIFKVAILFVTIFCADPIRSQINLLTNDSTFRLTTGIYTNFQEFKDNDPAIKQPVVNTTLAMFLGYNDSTGTTRFLKRDKVWGYCVEGAVYYKIKKYCVRLRNLGAITHFVDEGKAHRFMNSPNPTGQFLLDMNTGNVLKFEWSSVLSLISSDQELAKEYVALGSEIEMKRKKFIYINKFNMRNPISFPVSNEESIE